MASPAEHWAIAKDDCVYCGLSDFDVEIGPRSFIPCPCCRVRGTHKACEEAARGAQLSEQSLDNLNWFCSPVSIQAYKRLLCRGLRGNCQIDCPSIDNDTGLQECEKVRVFTTHLRACVYVI